MKARFTHRDEGFAFIYLLCIAGVGILDVASSDVLPQKKSSQQDLSSLKQWVLSAGVTALSCHWIVGGWVGVIFNSVLLMAPIFPT